MYHRARPVLRSCGNGRLGRRPDNRTRGTTDHAEDRIREMPAGYRRLAGSERRAYEGAALIEPAPADEYLEVTVILGRRPDGSPLPGEREHLNAPAERPRLALETFADRYGFDETEALRVAEFAAVNGLR